MHWLALVVALAGCDRVFGIDPITPIDAPPCTMPEITDDFSDMSLPCGTWGTLQTDGHAAWLVRQNHQLIVTPEDGVLGFASCNSKSSMPFGPSGVFVELSEVVGAQGFGIFQMLTYNSFTDTTHNANTQFTAESAFIALRDQDSCGPSGCTDFQDGAYVASQMHWLRMIPTNGGATITAQVSADGFAWVEFGHRDLPAGALANYVKIGIGAGNNGLTTPVGRMVFDAFDVCP